ncbi:hypothetical protein MMC26_000158 [Xylographa opegraphella]|nr:hypothetical protein [Xylographa opegraphella]
MAALQASLVSQLPATYLKALANRFSSTQLTDLTEENKKPLFVYGSLMFPSKIAFIIRDRNSADHIASTMTPAKLYDYERLAVRGASFPAVVKSGAVDTGDPMTEVDGLLIFDLTDAQRKYLDAYEGGLYNLMPVEVWVEVDDELGASKDGSVEKKRVVVGAEVYVWAGARDELIEVAEKVWDIDEYVDPRA